MMIWKVFLLSMAKYLLPVLSRINSLAKAVDLDLLKCQMTKLPERRLQNWMAEKLKAGRSKLTKPVLAKSVVVVVMEAEVTKNVHLTVITAITTVIKLIRLNTIKLPAWELFLFTAGIT